jgi:splicing factor 3B subunit 2
MQRFGPPPSYPNLKIPGLNSPIPLGAEWGYHPGGWGKPPVDEFGNPVYGGLWNPDKDRAAIVDLGNLNVRQGLWGEYVEESSDDEDDEVTDVIPTPSVPAPAAPAPIYSQGVAVTLFPPTAAGPQVPVATGAGPQALYRVLPQKSASMDAGALFPSRNVYDVADPSGGIATAQGIAQRATEVEDETVLTADMIKQQLAEHEAKSGETSKPKKKQKFKF